MDHFPRIKPAADAGFRAPCRPAVGGPWFVAGALAATGCAAPGGGAADLEVRVAAQSASGCPLESPLSGLPEEVTRVVLEVLDDGGKPGKPTTWTRGEDDLGLRQVLLEEIPVSEHARINMYACTGATLRWFGTSAPFAVEENGKTSASVTLRPVDALSCIGSGQGTAFDTFARLGRSRAFPAVAPLPDGRVFVAGGASKAQVTGQGSGALLVAELGEADYDVFDPVSTLFSPYLHREWAADAGRLMRPRVGGAAFAVGSTDAPAVLLVGGRPDVTWTTGLFGPLNVPGGAVPTQPFIEWLDVATETSVPVRSANGQGLVPRFLPATAQDPGTGTVVVAGGLSVDAVPAPSPWVDIISGRTVRSFPLAQARIGATLTPLGGDRFLLWGGDVGDCGATPAVLIDATQPAPIRPLALESDIPPSSCQAGGAMRNWWVTAWHTTTMLGTSTDTTTSLLVVGGMEVLENKVEQTPEIGLPGSPPNVLRLVLSADLQHLSVEPVEVPAEAAPLLRRALHAAPSVLDRVFVGGGWAAAPDGTVGLDAPPELVVIGIDAATRRPTSFTQGEGLVLSEGRLGPALSGTSDGSVLFAGGLHRGPVSIEVSRTAEVYVPRPTRDLCGGGLPVAPGDALPSGDGGAGDAGPDAAPHDAGLFPPPPVVDAGP